ncbi:E3 ubiquitin-protein ligase HOS1 [Zea mays]|uniref:E3 ubiquitin-protein ligase HOS1 n=3 Tax=Zea mays TaxID=4577 RepID=A0A1D6GI43_MAIZE|nr:E3 ubiquitin-protein ligase HOS1 [Zea mays]AQK63110.1 E3 ubiquitin-protein ligase HOS1 [Zea mays]
MDVQQLHSLFDVAVQNNLTSLICHYITDVCLDENAVSSDPLLAFLLDEVVIKDWCKRAVNVLITEIGVIYRSGLETMRSRLSQLQKFATQLAGIYSILEVMVSSFNEAVSAHVNDLHQLIENTLKAKQHLEAMIWCIRHRFIQDICSRYTDHTSWSSDVIQRKAYAEERKWPGFSDKGSDINEANQTTLFIEQALQNLGIEQNYRDKEEDITITCLQNEQSSSMFCSTITTDHCSIDRYPFKNLREAVDVLFLHGASDMVIAKQAILLYYLFDRHWSRPDSEWRYLVDDFATTFGITNRTLLECLVFCLLDDHSSEALKEACSLLPKIFSKETHPKIAQVLLERQRPDMALLVLKCTGRDSFSATENFEKDGISSLSEAVTAVRVRIECGLLTEAFMYHRSYCSKVKEQHSANMTHTEDAFEGSWIYHVEMMMVEFCTICIERNLVDKMIDLPWDSEEEKHLHKSLFESAHEAPMDPIGSLLVVYYLRRYRYLEAYGVDRSLQKFEQKELENATEEIASKIRAIAQWRESLVAKCLDMLPEVQRENVKAINSGEQIQFARTAQISSPAHVGKSQNPVMDLSTTFTSVLQNKSSLFSKNNALTDSSGLIRSSHSERKVPSALQTRAPPHGSPISNMRSTVGGKFPTVGQNVDSPFLRGAKGISSRKGETGFKEGIKYADHDPLPMYLNLSSGDTPTKDYRTSLLKAEANKTTYFQGQDSVGKGEFHFGSRAVKPFNLNGTGAGQNGLAKISGYAGFREDYKVPTKENILR